MDNCACDPNEFEPVEFGHSKTVIGRKDHRCWECRGHIPKGTSHYTLSGKWDGEVKTFRECTRCTEVRKRIHEEVECACGLGYGNMIEWIEDAELFDIWDEVTNQYKEKTNAPTTKNSVPVFGTPAPVRVG